MSESSTNTTQSKVGSLVISGLFVIAGFITLWDTTSYTDRDSQVFPTTVAIILIVTSAAAFILEFLRPTTIEGFGQGVWWRRVLLVVTMFLCCFAMPKIGFLPAGAIAFVGGLVSAMHDRWSVKTVLIYWGAGGVTMLAFYSLFKFGLHVPLP